MPVRKLVAIAAAAALIACCSWLTVPFAIPFTMQTFAVFCAVLMLGGRNAAAAVGLYLLLGAVGLPVFSGFRGGLGALFGPTGGFLFGFLFSALCSVPLVPHEGRTPLRQLLRLLPGLFACYFTGTLWFVVIARTGNGSTGILSVLTSCVFPYIVPDLIKMLLAVRIACRLRGHLHLND